VNAPDSSPDPRLPPASRRLWRLRKLHHFIDAEIVMLYAEAKSEGPHMELRGVDLRSVELRYAYDGRLSSRRVWPSKADALADASARRGQLERDGWTFHW
jgi:hypothetical protein